MQNKSAKIDQFLEGCARVIHWTESRCPNEFDRKIDNDENLINITTTTNIKG